jgi:hypothetical protein
MRTASAVFLLLALSRTAAADCRCPLPDETCPEAAAGAPQLGTPKAVTGVFVAFDEGVTDWDAELTRLSRCAGIKTVIIQSAEFDPGEARKLLLASKGKPVDVYVGVHYSASFSAGTSNLKQALREDKRVARMVMSWPDEVREHIDGWYIAHELHNFQIWREGFPRRNGWR